LAELERIAVDGDDVGALFISILKEDNLLTLRVGARDLSVGVHVVTLVFFLLAFPGLLSAQQPSQQASNFRRSANKKQGKEGEVTE
jgi:hypothetical protein